MAELSRADVIEYIKNISVLELSELIQELEETFGVSAAAPVALAMGGAAAGGEEAEAEEQTEFDAVLVSFGEKKIQVVKTVRAITGLGLKESKDLVEEAPRAVKEAVSKEEAADIKTQIEEAGGVVEIK